MSARLAMALINIRFARTVGGRGRPPLQRHGEIVSAKSLERRAPSPAGFARTNVLLALLILAALACRGGKREAVYTPHTGGNAARGEMLIRAYGCGACHTIPGVRGAHGDVAPPLTLFARRTYIGGELPNTPENLVRWIRNPHAVEPRTAMPALGLSDQQARDVAAYLYELR